MILIKNIKKDEFLSKKKFHMIKMFKTKKDLTRLKTKRKNKKKIVKMKIILQQKWHSK